MVTMRFITKIISLAAIILITSGCVVDKTVNSISNSFSSVYKLQLVKSNVERLLSTNECSGCYLEGANLIRANLSVADLSNANLAGAKLHDSNLFRANFKGANLTLTNLKRAKLSNANFSSAQLKYTKLIGADLRRANLTGANLTGADLRRANLTGAILTGVRGYNTLKVVKAIANKETKPTVTAKKSPPPLIKKPVIASLQKADKTPPIITIASNITVNEDNPTIRGTVFDNEKVIRVSVEGRSINLSSSNQFSFKRYVPRIGADITIEATDEWGNTATKVVHLTRKITETAAITYAALDPTRTSAKINPDAVALIIGISKYKKTAQAKYADRDAEYFADFARRKLGVSRANTKVLTNDKADLIDIIEATNVWLPNITRSEKSDIYVFFAGHGLGSDDGSNIYLLPYSGIPQVLSQTGVHRTKLFKTIAATKPNSVTVFLDTCYSGTSRTEETLIAQRGIRIVPKEQSIPIGFTVFSAAGMKQTAKMLDEAKHGLFSYYLMKGMEGDADSNEDRKITVGELHEYVLANVSRLQRNQTPELQGDGDRVLVKW